MLAVHDLQIRVGARVLMSDVSFRVSDGDKVGLVGRNGAGKTTLTKVLAGDLLPSEGRVERHGELGYLPQDAVDSLDAARFLEDNEEYWPFEGDDWPDEYVGSEIK